MIWDERDRGRTLPSDFRRTLWMIPKEPCPMSSSSTYLSRFDNAWNAIDERRDMGREGAPGAGGNADDSVEARLTAEGAGMGREGRGGEGRGEAAGGWERGGGGRECVSVSMLGRHGCGSTRRSWQSGALAKREARPTGRPSSLRRPHRRAKVKVTRVGWVWRSRVNLLRVSSREKGSQV